MQDLTSNPWNFYIAFLAIFAIIGFAMVLMSMVDYFKTMIDNWKKPSEKTTAPVFPTESNAMILFYFTDVKPIGDGRSEFKMATGFVRPTISEFSRKGLAAIADHLPGCYFSQRAFFIKHADGKIYHIPNDNAISWLFSNDNDDIAKTNKRICLPKHDTIVGLKSVIRDEYKDTKDFIFKANFFEFFDEAF